MVTDHMTAYLVDDSCTACGACLFTCPSHAFVVGVPLAVDPVRCTDCGACVEVCPADAITRVAPIAAWSPAAARPGQTATVSGVPA